MSFDPDAAFPLWSLGMALQQAGQLDEAVATLERAVAVTQREHCYEIALLGGALAAVGRTQEARALLDELVERARRAVRAPVRPRAAALRAGRAGISRSRRSRRRIDQRNALLWYRIHIPTLDSLRGEPRWRALAAKLGRTAPVHSSASGPRDELGDGR